MRKKCIFFLLILFELSLSAANNRGLYKIYNLKLSVGYYLNFYDDSNYYLSFDDLVTHDQVFHMLISCGTYNIKKDTIFLNDVNGSEMQLLKRRDNLLEVVHGFPFLSDLFFEFFRDKSLDNFYAYFQEFFMLKKMLSAQQKDLQEYKSSFKGLFVLREGSYVWGYEKLKLDIRKDNTYKFYYKKDILLLEGTWRRDGNLLFLYDTNLQYEFPAKISAGGIIGEYLPAVFTIPGYLLKYESDN